MSDASHWWWCAMPDCHAGGQGTDAAVQKSAEDHTKTTAHGTITGGHPKPAGWGEGR